ncbi:hemerythrin [Nitrospira sp.]|nr:hemerythrin [Nitrospira sp.]
MSPRSENTRPPKKAGKKSAADAVQMLKQDHRKVEQLFEQFFKGEPRQRAQVVQQLVRELDVHATLEEEIFYPALQQRAQQVESAVEEAELMDEDDTINGADIEDAEPLDDQEDLAEEETEHSVFEDVVEAAYEDHQLVKELLDRLQRMDTDSEEFPKAVAGLEEMIADHVSEEEAILFPNALEQLDTKAIGKLMHERRQELTAGVA